ncbi:MAG: hypothetical protein NC485_09360 [Ruminococcus flavefaciens]|nr:hypothetical protein [Ruminococcus flavefaciens]MCM1061178.1 hypothetical protein [Eubacterium sp.]
MKIINKIKEDYSAEVLLLAILSFLAGLTVGFLISPVKRGIIIGSYNGCNNRITDSNKVNKKTENSSNGS